MMPVELRHSIGGHIFNIQDDGTLVEMNQKPFENEDIFQTLLEKYPNLLAGDQINSNNPRRWLLVRREMGIPGEELGTDRWSLDHLFLDQDAVPTLPGRQQSLPTSRLTSPQNQHQQTTRQLPCRTVLAASPLFAPLCLPSIQQALLSKEVASDVFGLPALLIHLKI